MQVSLKSTVKTQRKYGTQCTTIYEYKIDSYNVNMKLPSKHMLMISESNRFETNTVYFCRNWNLMGWRETH